jgi:glycosyltransferase involved in cell wall biosynthesis
MPEPIRLLEVGLRWPPEAFVARKLEGLAARGVQVTVASRQVTDPSYRLPGVELLALPAGAIRSLIAALALAVCSPVRLARLFAEVRRVPPALARRHGGRARLMALLTPLARLRPDVVQFEWSFAAIDHLPLFAVWDCPVATSCRGSDLNVYPHVPALRHYTERLPELMRRAAAVHCVSEALGVEAAGFGLAPAKARIIRPAVDPTLFSPADVARGRDATFDIVTVGGLRWEKGYEFALAAVRVLADRGVPAALEMIGATGAGSEERRIRHTIADLGLGEQVRLEPALPSAEVAERLRSSDVLLLPSLSEGVPNVVLEAMACGVAVVASDCGGVREAVCDGVQGLLVAPRDAVGLAGALERLWRDPGLRARMGVEGRRTVVSGFTLDRQLDQFLELYRGLAA